MRDFFESFLIWLTSSGAKFRAETVLCNVPFDGVWVTVGIALATFVFVILLLLCAILYSVYNEKLDNTPRSRPGMPQ